MNIHGLDDQSLLVIFDRLTVEDLLRAGWVCLRWNAIRAKCALSRHSLTLFVGEHARDRVKNSKVDNIPFGHLLTDEHEMPLVPIKESEDRRNEIVRIKISSFDAEFLAHLFPNITNFTVSIQSDSESVHSLTCLLKVWSSEPTLIILKLYTFDPRNKDQIADKTELSQISVNRRLLSIINSITSLRVLTFDIDSLLFYVKKQMLYVGDVKLEFPMLNRLERLHWYSHDINWDGDKLVNALTQFDNANDNLNEIGINSEQCVCKDYNNWISEISPQLALRFTQLSLQIDDENISLLSPFCTRFINLTSLKLVLCDPEVNFKATQFFPPIASLAQLISLTIQATIINFDILSVDFANFNFNQHRNASVKVLKLEVLLRILADDNALIFDGLFLSNLFPNVQVFIFEQMYDPTIGTIADYDRSVLKRELFWCVSGLKNIKLIRSINPDREWSWQKFCGEYDDSEEDKSDKEDDDSVSDESTV